MSSSNKLSRTHRVRYKLKKANKQKLPRLSIFKSNNNFFAQIIDDSKGHTLVSFSSLSLTAENKKISGNKELSTIVGEKLAEKAKEKNIINVVFDRGMFKYHGRVKAFAESAKKNGLVF